MSDGSRISQTGDAARGITIFVQLRSDGPIFFSNSNAVPDRQNFQGHEYFVKGKNSKDKMKVTVSLLHCVKKMDCVPSQ